MKNCVPVVGLTFALPVESSDLRRLLTASIVRDYNKSVQGEFRGRSVTIIHTGVGERHCRERIESLVRSSQLKYLISAGFAGALDPKLQIGDLFLAENFSSPELLRAGRIKESEAEWFVGKMTTVPRIVGSKAERNHWAATTQAAAIDMESEFIASACATHKIPMLSLRAISDTPSEPLPAPPEVLFDMERQRTDFVRLGRYLVRYPGKVRSLIAFRQRVALARRSLTSALIRLLQVDLI